MGRGGGEEEWGEADDEGEGWRGRGRCCKKKKKEKMKKKKITKHNTNIKKAFRSSEGQF